MSSTWRGEIGQATWFAREYRSPARWRAHLRSTRGLRWPGQRRARRDAGSVWGVSMVRDEVDVIEPVVRHLLDQGLDRLVVADNLSVDGTLELLGELARDEPRLVVLRDLEPAYFQAEKMSRLAHLAGRAGADWVVPFDADELWFAEQGSVKEHLAREPADVCYAHFHHMIPTEVVDTLSPSTELVMDATPSFPGKVAFRSHPLSVLVAGNHDVARVGDRAVGLRIAHAQYRSPAQVARKLRQGAASVDLTQPADNIATHWRLGAGLDDDTVAEVWARISRGLPDERIGFRVVGPTVRVRPFGWRTWDPDGVVPDPTPAS